ncbi:hypothetical protein ACFVRE_42880, partial [Streptomyces sp. NPDC057910]
YIHRHRFTTRTEARIKLATWIADFYNTRRRHTRAGGLPPTEFEQKISQQRDQAHQKAETGEVSSPLPSEAIFARDHRISG